MAARAMIAIGRLLVAALFAASPLHAAVISRASIDAHDQIVELHFGVRGRGLKWNLSSHGQQLWIELEHAKLELPPRPLDGREVLPVTMVRAVEASGGRAQLIVGVNGKVDYAIARMPHELVIRFAPAGKVPDLAAPILVAMERNRAPTRAIPRRMASIHSHPEVQRPASSVPAGAGGENAASAGFADHVQAQARAFVPPVTSAAALAGNPTGAEDAARTSEGMAALVPPRIPANRSMVVIDPGHGGHDPGTQAPGIVVEKDAALAIAMRLRDALAARGVDVRMTRDNDTFLSLAERTQEANRIRADLFISIHLNSSPDSNTAGIETYYLNNTTDRATIRLARMENGEAAGYGAPGQPNLNYILTDLRQGYKANESASLARMIEAETVADADASMGFRVNALGAKMGPFYVLVGAEMPAVLVECGFLSNPNEARMLTAPRYQQAIADGIATAVVHYFNGDAAVGNL
jgi:N-acetylmuramoyl-L-alanine amidase